jgi:hypothetical protein
MNRAQWTLVLTLAASSYSIGTIWMVQAGYRIWPYVAPGDFDAYHGAWWMKIIPVIFPVAGVAFIGSFALLWWRPAGVAAWLLWANIAVQLVTHTLTIAFWGRWQARTHFARLMDGTLDPTYARIMDTHWVRAVLITVSGLLVLWMMIEHLSRAARSAMPN